MKHSLAVLLLLCSLIAGAAVAQPSIRWEPFELRGAPAGIRAQLGRMTVPLVRGDAEGGSAEIVFVRLQSGEGSANPPIVYLAGGPGGSGISVTRIPPMLAGFARLTEAGDLILLDPRGVGQSSPRPLCRAPRPLEPHEKFADSKLVMPEIVRNARACVEEWRAKGVDVRGFTNRESAADLDDLRRALGVPKISIFGFSYGTHLALSALHSFPESIERLVLVGTEGPNQTRKLPFTLDTQLAKLSILAGMDMNAALRRVLTKLEKDPVSVSVMDQDRQKEVEVPIGPAGLQRILSSDIGDGNDFTVFPALLATLVEGDTSILRWFVDKRYNQITGGTNLMVAGMECSSGATATRQREIEQQARTSLFGNSMNFPYPGLCAALPAVDLGDAFRQPVPSHVPVLFISGTLDSNTPPFQAEEVRWGMPRATHLIVEHAGHEDTLGIPAVQEAIVGFLAGRDVSHVRAAMPRPRFLTVEEAKKDRAVARDRPD